MILTAKMEARDNLACDTRREHTDTDVSLKTCFRVRVFNNRPFLKHLLAGALLTKTPVGDPYLVWSTQEGCALMSNRPATRVPPFDPIGQVTFLGS